MILVREWFITKPGQASRLAGMFKGALDAGLMGRCRILTDLTGDFNKVVLETELDSLAEFERRLQEYRSNEALAEKMKGYTEMYLHGGREIYQVSS